MSLCLYSYSISTLFLRFGCFLYNLVSPPFLALGLSLVGQCAEASAPWARLVHRLTLPTWSKVSTSSAQT